MKKCCYLRVLLRFGSIFELSQNSVLEKTEKKRAILGKIVTVN